MTVHITYENDAEEVVARVVLLQERDKVGKWREPRWIVQREDGTVRLSLSQVRKVTWAHRPSIVLSPTWP